MIHSLCNWQGFVLFSSPANKTTVQNMIKFNQIGTPLLLLPCRECQRGLVGPSPIPLTIPPPPHCHNFPEYQESVYKEQICPQDAKTSSILRIQIN